MSKKQNGFALIGPLLLTVLIAVVIFVGFNVVTGSKTTIKNSPAAHTVIKAPKIPVVTDNLSAISLPLIDMQGWQIYHQPSRQFSYSYPSTWTLKDNGIVRTTIPDSQQTVARQIITSNDGAPDVDYTTSLQDSGAQISISSSFDPQDLPNNTVDCKRDLNDYRLLKQYNVNNLVECLIVQKDSEQYVIRFNSSGQSFNVLLTIGKKVTSEQRKTDAQILIAIATSLRFP
jgi:hypothetical protein